MASIRKLATPAEGDRVETGAIRFGEDWPGLVLRGDNAIPLAHALEAALEFIKAHAAERKMTDSLDLAIGQFEWIYRIIMEDVKL